MENKGVIYILTNPSFPDYVKIGYADDINRRLKELNRSECIPFAFRVYATYEVSTRLKDLKLHHLIDKLNPNLRSIETFNGQKRVREFYAISPDDAYRILEAIAEINGSPEKLVKWELTQSDEEAEITAQEIDTESADRMTNFSFSKCRIPIGDHIEYAYDETMSAIVVDDRNVKYNGEVMSLTALAKLLSGKKYSIAGPKFFKYRGEWLNDLRHRLGV